MRKLTAVLVLFALVTVGAFAQIQMSAGGGLLFDYSSGNGLEGYGMSTDFNITSIGLYGFFDATYVEASAYFAIGFSSIDESGESFDAGLYQLGFTLLGKYPFNLGVITLFPMAGISYNLVLDVIVDGESVDDAGDFSQFGFLFGVGMDYDLSDKLFLRASALFHLRLPSKAMSDFAEFPGVDATLGLGPRINVGVGFRF